MAFIDCRGVKIFYRSSGSGPAILLSNGFGATSAMWDGQITALAADCQLICWDMRGHGDSDSPDDPAAYSEMHTVDDMAAILNACGATRAVIGGLSLGGYMSLAFNLKYPQMVRALMLFDTGPGYKSDEARAGWNVTSEKTAAAFERKGLAALSNSEETKLGAHRSAHGLSLAALGMLRQFDARIINSLPDIQVPTLVLAGANDKPFLGATDYMAAKIPNSTKALIPDAGHAANIHQPVAFNAAVRSFLQGLPD